MCFQPFDPANRVHALLRTINGTRGYGDIVAVEAATDDAPGRVRVVRPYAGTAIRRFTVREDGFGYLLGYCGTTRRLHP